MKLNIILLFIVLSTKSLAADIFSLEILSLRVNTGILQSTSNEIVYRNSISPTKLSELIWENDINLIGIGTTLEASEFLKFNADIYISSGNGSGTMEDYDWMDFNIDDWTHLSQHPTRTNVLLGDINSELLSILFGNINMFFIVGYKYDYLKSTSFGGSYTYSSTYDTANVGEDSSGGFRDSTGTISDSVDGVTYQQYYHSLYLGIGGLIDERSYSIKGKAIYSNIVSAKAEDTHHLRNLFNEFESEGTLLGISLKGSYKITEYFLINASYKYEKYNLERSTLTQTYLDTGSSSSGTGGGMEHTSSLFNFGIEYKF